MKYLVTGGAGFIGSHLVEVLVANDQEVVVLDNLSSGRPENLAAVRNRITLLEGDVRDPATCVRAVAGCHGVFHQAGLVSVPDSIARPRDNHEINITGTWNLFDAARQAGVRRVLFASSASVYGDNPTLPKHEGMALEPKSPYAAAKCMGEHYARVYAECYGMGNVTLRYFNVYGPRQDPASMYSGVISKFIQCSQTNAPPTLFGDGSQTRDFVHVKDVVQANLKAMAADLPARFSVFNVGTGQQTSLLDILNELGRIKGAALPVVKQPERPGDIHHSVASIESAREILHYDPSIALNAGLSTLLCER